MIEINVNVRFPDLLGVLEQLKQELPKQNMPVLNDLVNRQPEPPVLPTTVISGPDVPKATFAQTPVSTTTTYAATGSDQNATKPVSAPIVPVEPPKAPTEAPSFTLAQVARAGADLLTAKPTLQGQLVELLGKYGAATVVELKPEHLGAFAAELRKMGAKI